MEEKIEGLSHGNINTWKVYAIKTGGKSHRSQGERKGGGMARMNVAVITLKLANKKKQRCYFPWRRAEK